MRLCACIDAAVVHVQKPKSPSHDADGSLKGGYLKGQLAGEAQGSRYSATWGQLGDSGSWLSLLRCYDSKSDSPPKRHKHQ